MKSRYFSFYYLFFIGGMSIFSVYMPKFYKENYGFSNADITFVFSGSFLIMLLCGLPIGKLIDKISNYALYIKIVTLFNIIAIILIFNVNNVFIQFMLFMLYTVSKLSVAPIVDMYALEAQNKNIIIFGKVRSFGALGYASFPIIMTLFFQIFSLNLMYLVFISITVIANFQVINVVNSFSISKKNEKSSKKIDRSVILRILLLALMSFMIFPIQDLQINLQTNFLNDFVNLKNPVFVSSVAIFLGAFFEWPLMNKSERVISKLGLHKIIVISICILILRFSLTYVSGLFSNVFLYYFQATLKSLIMAFYIPISMKTLRNIIPLNSLGFGMAFFFTIGSLVNYLFFSLSSFLLLHISINNLFLLSIVFCLFNLVTVLFLKNKINILESGNDGLH